MVLRSTMVDLVALFRAKGNASTDDVFNGVTYWTDEQLQEILDETKELDLIPLLPVGVGNTVFALDMKRHHKLEEDYTIYTSNSQVVADTVAYDVTSNTLTFDTAQTGVMVAEAWRYNMYKALTELYDRKASHREFYVTLKSGNHQQRLEQEYQHCINRRDYYRNKIARRLPKVRENRWRT